MKIVKLLEVKISQFADDTTVFLKNEQSLYKAMEKIRAFSKVAGPTLNINKSKGFLLGSLMKISLMILIGQVLLLKQC